MAKIVYRILESGQAVDLYPRRDNYELRPDEKPLPGDRLPDINTLHEKDWKPE